MKKTKLFLIILFMAFSANSQSIVLEFNANHSCEQVGLDSIWIQNLTQGGKMVLYHPNNVAVFTITDIEDFDPQHNHLYVSQNYPNPFSAQTYIDVHLASPDHVSITVYDLTGRTVARYEDNLDEGMHQFLFSAGVDKTYILTVNSGKQIEKRIMLQMGVAGSAGSEISYLGAGAGEAPKTAPKSSDFNFNPGDNLRFTGFVTDLAGNVDYGVINDAPEESSEYLFDIANTPPSQPSEISGESYVPVNTTGLIYEVEEQAGLTYLWSVPDGWEITQGQGSNSITLDAGAQGGDITVKAENACGISEASVLSVEVYVPVYDLTLHVEPTEGGNADGEGSYQEDDEVPITATPNEGWEFTGWTGDTDYIDNPDLETATVTMPADDVNLTAHFEMTDYTLTLVANPSEGGTVSGGGEYNVGDEVPIQADANTGWTFVNWTGDTQYVDDVNAVNATVTMPADDVSLTANFEMTDYTLTLEAEPSEGGTVSGAGQYNFGDEVPIEATSNEGWEFVGWTGDTEYLDDSDSAEATVTMPADNVMLTAVFQEEDDSDVIYGEGVTDIDGNEYMTVIIGSQEWMAENLRTTRDADGNDINRHCYDDDETNCDLYGGLYTWSTVMNGESSSDDNPSGVQGVCPDGWHVPSDDDWTQLVDYVVSQGHPNDGTNPNGAGNALKSCRQVDSPLGGDCDTSEHPRWNLHSTHYGFDEFGFSALPGGYRNPNGSFYNIGYLGYWWSSTEDSSAIAWGRRMLQFSGDVNRFDPLKTSGYSLRCVQDLGAH